MTQHAKVLIIGGGTAGISVAARLAKAKVRNVVLLEPSDTHYYQPLWTLVGAGLEPFSRSARPMSKLIPKGVRWIQQAASHIDPHTKTVTLGDETTVTYEKLVVAAGIQTDWDAVPGMAEAVHTDYASSNFEADLAPRTWELIRNLRSGTAVFTQPSGAIKCAGAPQKIAYLAADYWRKQGVLGDIRIIMVLPTPQMFGIPVYSAALERKVSEYGIEVRFESEVTHIDPENRIATVEGLPGTAKAEAGEQETIQYDFMHVVPRMSAPDWLKATELADPNNPAGYVEVDKHTLQHVRFPDIFALGDNGSTPNSKTGAAIRKQAPVVAKNIVAALDNQPFTATYDGYASCPIPVGRDQILIAEFDYTTQPQPSLPLINTLKPVKDYGLFKRRLLPILYWDFMMKGLA